MAGEIEHIKGKGFDKHPENINRKGRPRKLISDVLIDLENEGIKATTKDEVKDCYMRLINLTEQELNQRKADSEQPILIQKVAKAILSGKGLGIIETMLDRAIGKPQTSVEHSGEVKQGEPVQIIFKDFGTENTDND